MPKERDTLSLLVECRRRYTRFVSNFAQSPMVARERRPADRLGRVVSLNLLCGTTALGLERDLECICALRTVRTFSSHRALAVGLTCFSKWRRVEHLVEDSALRRGVPLRRADRARVTTCALRTGLPIGY